MFSKGFFSQVSITDSLNIQISNVLITLDTSQNVVNYNLSFKLNVQNIENLKSLSLTIVDQNDIQLIDVGSYDAKLHVNGFYYIETTLGKKNTVMGNEIFFMTVLNLSSYNTCKAIKLSYKSKIDLIKNVNFIIPK